MSGTELTQPATEIAALMTAVRALVEVTAVRATPVARHKLGDVLTPDEAADLLRVPVAAVRRMAVTGELPGRLIDDDWRFATDAVFGWLAAGTWRGARRGGRSPDDYAPPQPPTVPAIEWTDEIAQEADEFMARLERLRQADNEVDHREDS